MNSIALEGTSSQVAMQALIIVVAPLDTNWIRRRAHVLHVNPGDTLELILQRAEDRVVCVAGITGHVRWNSVVLKVLSGNISGIVHVEASTVGLHRVAGNAELRLFGTLHVNVHSSHNTEYR